jgi:hypothetical protein
MDHYCSTIEFKLTLPYRATRGAGGHRSRNGTMRDLPFTPERVTAALREAFHGSGRV